MILWSNMSRIDIFYVSVFFRERGGQQSILRGTTLSDHFPIILNIREDIRPIKKQRRIPKSIFSDSKLAWDVEEIWRLHMQSPLNILEKVSRALENISLFFKKQVELCYEAYTTQEQNSRRAVASLQHLLEKHPWL